MTKIESGRTHLYEKIFDFQEFLHSLEEMFRIQADVKDIEFEIQSIDPLPLYIQSDEIKLRQVLINLVSNALKFTTKGSVTLRTRAWCWSDRLVSESTDTCLLQFQVQDTGPGILPEEQSSLFQAFSQTQTGRLAQTGSGLGLAISRNFIRLMGGDIFVESVPQQGTCFTVEVLVKSLRSSQEPIPSRLSETEALSSSDPSLNLSRHAACRVLLLLHTPDLQHWLPQCLRRVGWEVRSMEGAAELCPDWYPDLFLVEWGEDNSVAEQVTQRLRPVETHPPDEAQPTNPLPSKHSLTMAIVPDSLVEKAPGLLGQGWDRVLLPPHHPQILLEQLYAQVFHQEPDARPSR